ncbi:MAG TPA: YIP1 family protein [Dehalococcoidia bacterium]|nr:YIP1 family protein [Dehalococcoidia bacterium]
MDLQEVITWLKRLVNLDTRVFDEIRTNPTATIPGALVAFVSILIAGLGGWLWWVVEKYPNKQDIFVHSAIFGSIFGFVLWAFVWLGLVYVVLTQFFRERAYVEQLLRVMGLAASPLALMGLMFIPEISFAIGLAALVLAFGLTNIAIRSVTSADPARVMVANLLGFFVWCAALTLLAKASNPNSPGIFLFNSVNRIAHEVFSLRG